MRPEQYNLVDNCVKGLSDYQDLTWQTQWEAFAKKLETENNKNQLVIEKVSNGYVIKDGHRCQLIVAVARNIRELATILAEHFGEDEE